ISSRDGGGRLRRPGGSCGMTNGGPARSLDARISMSLPRVRLDAELSVGTETLALVGPSGAGKSSILRCVAGLPPPAMGRVELGMHLRELGLPSILVSHDVGDVLGLADRIAVLEQGRVVQSGTAGELLEAPASAFVAAFTGVNYFAGNAVRLGHLTAVRSSQGDATFLSTDAEVGSVGAVVYPW